MFLNYLHSDKKIICTQHDYGNTLVRMPQIIMLVGEYEDDEIAFLEDNLKKHFPVDNYVFWLCVGNANISSTHKKRYVYKSEKNNFLELRLELAHLISNDNFITFCEETVADIFNSTSNLICQEAGGIYLAVICKAEQPDSGMVAPTIEKIKELLLDQFAMVNIDLYMLLDQSAYKNMKIEKESSVYLSLLEAERLVADKILRLAYVLSNIDSKGRFRDKKQVCEEAYASIALMISIKNLIPNNAAYKYSDADFGKSVVDLAQSKATETGMISSIGHMHLQTDEEFNSLAAYLAVWNKLSNTSDDTKIGSIIQDLGMEKKQIKQYFASSYRMRNMDETDFETIVRNRSINERIVYTMKNGDAVSKFFGNNLALYYELNVRSNNLHQRIIDWFDTLNQKMDSLPSDVSNIDIENILENIESSIRSLVDESDELVEDRRNKLSKWESMLFSANSKKGKDTKPLFELAANYIRIKNDLYIASQQKLLYEELLQRITDLSIHYQKFKTLVYQTVESIENVIKEKESDVAKPGNGLGLLQITNAKKYYKNITTKLLCEDCAKDFGQLLDELRKMVSSRSFSEEKTYKFILNFCKKSIFINPIFQMSFLEELQGRLIGYEDDVKWEIKSGTDVSNFLLTTIIDAQHTLYYDGIYQGFQTYEEMCLFLRDDTIFMEAKDRDAHVANIIREQKMKLFCDKNSDSLDVIFIAGNLKPQNLHKWKNYENSYKKLMENS